MIATNFILSSGSRLSALNDFVYGDLESIYPSSTYEEIKAIREQNWDTFKRIINNSKGVGGVVRFRGGRIEMYFPYTDSIMVSSGELVDIGSSTELTLVMYPFVNRAIEEWIFDVTNGGSFKMTNVIAQAPEKSSKYETYTSVLKKDSNVRLIEITETVRTGFWDDLTNGDTLYYSWPAGSALQTGIVSSFNSGLKQITLTADINGSVGNNTSGNIGLYFKEEISLSDYNTYGDFWIPQVGGGVPVINFLRYSSSGSEDSIITINNSSVKNFFLGMYGNNQNVDIVIENNCMFSGSAVGLSLYGNNDTSTNSRLLITGTLNVTDNAYPAVGSFSSNDALYGSGVYIHPNIEVYSTGVVNVYDNISEGWIQYSASGEKPILPGLTSYFAEFNGWGNGQRDIITSNSMPTIFDEFNVTISLLAGNTIINGGTMSLKTSASIHPDNLLDDYYININDSNIQGVNEFSWGGTSQTKLEVTFNNCTFHPALLTGGGHMIFDDSAPELKKLSFIGCTVALNDAIDGRFMNLIRMSNIHEIYIDSLTVDAPTGAQDLRILGNDFAGPAGQIVQINNNSVIPAGISIRGGSSDVDLISVLDEADGINSSFSGSTNLFKTTPFSVAAAGVSTVSDNLIAEDWDVVFSGVPANGVDIIATGHAI